MPKNKEEEKTVTCTKCYMIQRDRGQVRCTTSGCGVALPTEGRQVKKESGVLNPLYRNHGYQPGVGPI